jgi:alkyl hydroperoxide reductase subunit AhpC
MAKAREGDPAPDLVRRAIFIVDPEGMIRHRDVGLLGVGFTGLDEIGDRLAALQPA